MTTTEASLEALVETGILPGPVFHPGGLELSIELANICEIGPDSQVLDVACGTGETAYVLAEKFGCRVVGIDTTELQIKRAEEKRIGRSLRVEFHKADAHHLPFEDGVFDVVISEAVLCYLEIGKALDEMIRVVRPGGRVGIHDMCWRENTPSIIKQRYAEIENEHPETLGGWAERFTKAGLVMIRTVDKSQAIRDWSNEYTKKLGLLQQGKIVLAILKRWGLAGLQRIRESEGIWKGEHASYGIVVGTKADTHSE